MITTKNLTQKFVTALIALSMLSVVPAFAYANDGLHLGSLINVESRSDSNLGLHLGTSVRAQVKADKENDQDENGAKIGVGAQFGADVKVAAKTFNQALKDANKAFKTAKVTARAKFVAAVNVATDQAGKIVALKAYFADVLAALKIKSASVEAAFQAFINAHV